MLHTHILAECTYYLVYPEMENHDLHIKRRRNWPSEWECLIEGSLKYNIEQIYSHIPEIIETGPSNRIIKLEPPDEPKWNIHVGIHLTKGKMTIGACTWSGWKGEILATAGIYLNRFRNPRPMGPSFLYPNDFMGFVHTSMHDVCTVQATDTFFVVHRVTKYVKLRPMGSPDGDSTMKYMDQGINVEQSFNVGDTLYCNSSIWTICAVLEDAENGYEAEEFQKFQPDIHVDFIIKVPKGTWYNIGKDNEVILPSAKFNVVKINAEECLVFVSLTETPEILDFKPMFENLDASEQAEYKALGKEWVAYGEVCEKYYDEVMSQCTCDTEWNPIIRSMYMDPDSAKNTAPNGCLQLNNNYAMIQTKINLEPLVDKKNRLAVLCQVRVPLDRAPKFHRRSWDNNFDVEVWPKGTVIQFVGCSNLGVAEHQLKLMLV